MILEVAILKIKPEIAAKFEAAFATASLIISSMPGYISHELQRCLEVENQYVLLVRWAKLEDHTIGFRQSPEYQNGVRCYTIFTSHFRRWNITQWF